MRFHRLWISLMDVLMELTAWQCRRFQKSGSERNGTLYWLTLMAAVASLGAAAHFGVVFVYGA